MHRIIKAFLPAMLKKGGGSIINMSYLQSLPRQLVTVYLPLSLILFVLLFPFYWMALTSVKPDEQLLDLETYSPFWTCATQRRIGTEKKAPTSPVPPPNSPNW